MSLIGVDAIEMRGVCGFYGRKFPRVTDVWMIELSREGLVGTVKPASPDIAGGSVEDPAMGRLVSSIGGRAEDDGLAWNAADPAIDWWLTHVALGEEFAPSADACGDGWVLAVAACVIHREHSSKLSELVGGGDFLCLRSRFGKARRDDGGEDAQDHHDDQDFDKREGTGTLGKVVMGHSLYLRNLLGCTRSTQEETRRSKPSESLSAFARESLISHEGLPLRAPASEGQSLRGRWG